jgi:hypothetical protein
MDSLEFRIFLDLLMCCDPWPMEYGQENMTLYADRLSRNWGFTDWIHAYHGHTA